MLLGIDYGLKNIGIAISQGYLAEPYITLEISDINNGVKKIGDISNQMEGVEKLVVGISEGKSRNRALSFGHKLEKILGLPVEFVDETLTTVEANNLSKKSKKEKEHAKAAAIILQRYLDENIR